MLFYLGQLEGHLVLPEVVKREWSAHWIEHARKQYKAFQSSRGWLDGHVEGVPAFQVDIEEAAAKALAERLDELGDLLVEEPIGANDWHQAGSMVLAKRRPTTEGSQQFKDSLLWQVLLRVGQEQTVLFVSADKGFQSSSEEGALAPSLAAEAAEKGSSIRLFKTRQELLDLMKGQKDAFITNLEGMWLDIENPFIEKVDDVLAEEGLVVGSDVGWTTEVFATGDPKKVVVSLEMRSEVADVEDPSADMPWYAMAAGSALVDIDTWETDVSLESVTFQVSTPHGDIDRKLLEAGRSRRKVLTRLDIASVTI